MKNTTGNYISLGHGGGGRETASLINNIIKRNLGNSILDKMEDGAVLTSKKEIVYSTDSFVVSPLFFPGGDIGKLSICGTVNDISVMGARPVYMSFSLIIEEGFSVRELEKIVESAAATASEAGIDIVCGDTKVVEKGSCDGIYINTSGIGYLESPRRLSCESVNAGDSILISGDIGRHGACIMALRNNIGSSEEIASDCALLTPLTYGLYGDPEIGLRMMRDTTRGGLAAALNEIAEASCVTISIEEESVPVSKSVAAVSGLLGISPFTMACEGRFTAAVKSDDANKALDKLRSLPGGENAAIIGRAEEKKKVPAVIVTPLGARRVLEMPRGEMLPRIC
ncbi:MAG: hydrogenase expression/formation protein HypE [Fibrobacterota bacterium]